MAGIPLDLQRRCERRWVARFFRPDPNASKTQEPETQDQQLAAAGKGKRKASRVKRVCIGPLPAE